MGKIQCVYDKDNNFFFHLMSVAKVGYDNAYGEKHKDSMSSEDIAAIKKYEKELTMKGGEYNGKLFWTGMYAGNADLSLIATIPLAFTTGIFAGRYLEKHCEKKEAKLPVGAEEEDDDDFDWDEPITLRNP